MDKLTQDFANSLIVSAEDGIKDCMELGIDSFIEDGVLKEFPIVSTIVSGLKIAKNIYDRNLLKQTLTFIDELNNGSLSKDELIKYQLTIQNNNKKCEEELGRVMIYLNSFLDKEKSIMLAKLFKVYIKQQINWDSFCEFSEIINRIFIQDLHILHKIKNRDIDLMFSREDEFRAERLYSIGLIGMSFKALTYGDIKNGHINSGRTISPLGKQFCEIVF